MVGGVTGVAVCGFGSLQARSCEFDVCVLGEYPLFPSRHYSISDSISEFRCPAIRPLSNIKQ